MSMTTGLTLGQIFSRTMALYRPAASPVFVGIMLPLAVVQGLLQGGAALLQSVSGAGDGPLALGMSLVSLAFFMVTVLIAVVIGIIGACALAHAGYEIAAGRTPVAADSWRQGLRFRVWGTTLLAGVGIVLGLVFCVLPGLYAALVWAFALPVVFDESLAHSKALGRSNELSQVNPQGGVGNDPRFRSFLIYVATFVTTYILSAIASLPVMIVALVLGFRAASGGDMTGGMPAILQWLQVPTAVATSFVQSALMLFSAIAISVHFFDVRGRIRATDLDAALDRMTAPDKA